MNFYVSRRKRLAQRLLSFTKHQLTRTGPESVSHEVFCSLLAELFRIQLCLISIPRSIVLELVLLPKSQSFPPDGNDKIEEKLGEKKNKEGTKKKTLGKETERPTGRPTRRKKVDLTFDYDPEKECE